MQTPWQQTLTAAFTHLDELLNYLKLEPSQLGPVHQITKQFGLRVPRGFAARMKKGDPRDPLLLQVLPQAIELQQQQGFSANPVGDLEAQVTPGVLHKYHGRALIIATGACAVHCRYCFRRHYPYDEGIASPRQWNRILDYLRADPSISEVILSGGDPLMVNDARLASWLGRLSKIPQLRRLRLHTRLPVVLPERITPELLALLADSPLQNVIVIHTNHPNELSSPVVSALARLRETNSLLLNQAVLLRGINDTVETLASLSEGLFAAGVLPYYLHLLDRVAGAAHFEVAEASAKVLYRQLLVQLPGYLVPKLVREKAGEYSKLPINL